MMGTMWVIMANNSFAKIFEVRGYGKHIKEIQHIDNPVGRMKPREILQDRPGRAFDRVGAARHALGTEIDVKSHEQKIFASKLAETLKEGRANHSFNELVLIAPPQFLGELKLALDDQVKKSISKEIDKDLPIHLSEKERIESLCRYLDLWNYESSQQT
jgi:protein required for attachment to host cells